MTVPIIHPVVEDEAQRRFRERVLPALRAALGDEVFVSWFSRLQLDAIASGTARLSVPTKFLSTWIRDRYQDRLLAVLAATFPEIVRVEVGVRSATCARAVPQVPAIRSAPVVAPVEPAPTPAPTPASSQPPATAPDFRSSPLDARHTFASFVVGRTNRLAHSAAARVAEEAAIGAPQPSFNPLFLHSVCGLGKTHLLQAIAFEAASQGRRALYLTAERFMYGFVLAMRDLASHALRARLRDFDVLIIDDVQFLQGRSIQQEFRQTVSARLDSGRALVLAADRAPVELEALDAQARSRIAGGLSVEIAPPDFETRLAMVRGLAESAGRLRPGFALSEDVAGHVAEVIATDGRDLAGAVNRLVAFASMSGAELTVETAGLAIRDLVRTREPKRVKIEDIQKLVASHYGVTRHDILSIRRTANVVRPRQLAMYLAKIMTLRSLPEIGRRFGGRDHTTVIHAVRKVETLRSTDKSLDEELVNLRCMLEDA